MKMRISEGIKDKLIYGCFLGLVLFASSVVCISLVGNMAEVEMLMPYIWAVLVGYLLFGNLLFWIHCRPRKGRFNAWFKGSAAIYWIFLALAAIVFVSHFLSNLLRITILVNLAVIVLWWIWDYCSIIKIAKELNGRITKDRYLVVDIEECPKNVEAFCREIEDYCSKSRIKLEFITRGKPAEIKMDGELYQVELDTFYSQFGPMYALKFKQMFAGAKGSDPLA